MRNEIHGYLIQRCESRADIKRPADGFDAAFRLHYMGAAEFEFGSLPASLRRVCTDLAAYSFSDSGVSASSGPVLIFCKPDQISAATEIVKACSTWTHRSKECVYLDRSVKGTHKRGDYSYCDLWWDIKDDWFFCAGQPIADLLLESLRALKTRWANA